MAHPSRHNDFQVAIVFDQERLELLQQDYLWLSETPRIEKSKNWDSMGIRTLNVARFRDRITGSDVIAFNTHLDVKSELARRKQAEIVSAEIQKWIARHPKAAVFLFGDFNCIPGHKAHSILSLSGLQDAWPRCSASESCVQSHVAHSFHGWTGGHLFNSYSGRMAMSVVLTLHGLGLNLPLHVPRTWRDITRAFWNVFTTPPKFNVADSLPLWPFNRFHVDWIFHSPHTVAPHFIGVMDVREADFSSDHFPIVAVFQ
eukprot:CAMPEP_0175947040 /NCGR_PEP_ID=MMETSP0108-20121206/27663_1 /TAXON_ID=195067 ORGANISM="Goniomonas pacifica, Strain CCMP1869" /NCGR_SAMPLE_ID=MMETSP0108 /ASSEMBLY_ACC=CAM_ASM_000204 /LENGTH=257 /DNA_ID=CAMNT_0017272623 /DNA_START=259 /DNA_END=1032 /DNA_ORIENTATION=+